MNKNLIKQVFLLVFLLTVIVAISLPFFRNMAQRYRLNKEMSGLQKEIDGYNKKNDDLRKAIDYLKSDQFTEEQARLKMGLKKNGEDVVVIKTEGTSTQSEGDINIFDIPGIENTLESTSKENNPIRWWAYFFKSKNNS